MNYRLTKYLFAFLCVIISNALMAQEVIYIYHHVYDEHTKQLKAKFTYENSQLRCRLLYYYNSQGICFQKVLDDGTSENPDSLDGVTRQLITTFDCLDSNQVKVSHTFIDLTTGEEKFLQEINLKQENDLHLLNQVVVDAEGNRINTQYDAQSNKIAILEDPIEGFSKLTTLAYDQEGEIEAISYQTEDGINIVSVSEKNESEQESTLDDHFSDHFGKARSNTASLTASERYPNHKQVKDVNEGIKLVNEDIENIAHHFMNPFVFRISAYQTYPAVMGVHGDGEINDKVRITLINGILNFPHDRINHLNLFSQLHGGTNIHYVFRPCEGWSQDMFHCATAKLGIISDQARALAEKWREMIEEMGGMKGGGVIIHYAHSVGGTETDNAKRLMTAEELKMIRVYTIASPTIIHNDGFQYVINYVSKRDGVCYLDPIDYFFGLFFTNSDTNIVYLDTFLGTPIVDHLITNESYRTIIEKLGAEFVRTYSVR